MSKFRGVMLFTIGWFAISLFAGVTHPLDALTSEEINRTTELLTQEQLIDGDSRITSLTLREPSKAEVMAWNSGDSFSRHAFVIVKHGELTYEGVVDLNGNSIMDWREVEGVEPSILFGEVFGATATVLSNDTFREALVNRGLADPDNVYCVPLTVGHFSEDPEQRRLMRVPCFDLNGTLNAYAKPIAGLYGIVDLDTSEVIEVVDHGIITKDLTHAMYNEDTIDMALQKPLNRTVLRQYGGQNFKVDGHVVTWNNWKFHYRMDKRVGGIISLATFNDKGSERMVMYQGTLSEVFVPYVDPTDEWFWKTFIDAGEYGMGLLASPIFPGVDVPRDAWLDGMSLPDDVGIAYDTPGVIAIFERNTGEPNWRHFEFGHPTGPYFEGRPEVELVVRSIGTIGNYDYTVDWIFTLDGKIKVNTTANGIDQTKTVQTAHMSDETATEDTAYGTLLTPHRVGVNHSHFFNYRLDMDVDGQENTLVKSQLVAKAPEEGPRQSIWVVEHTPATKENEAQLNYTPATPTRWRVVNTNKQNYVGNPVSYVLMAGDGTESNLTVPNSFVEMRGEFIKHQLWVTPYHPDELYSAGLYVNQKNSYQGLAKWTAENRDILNTDIVLWYTVTFNHVPRSEDWPVTPRITKSFAIMPFNFFDKNPAINMPNNWSSQSIQFKNKQQ